MKATINRCISYEKEIFMKKISPIILFITLELFNSDIKRSKKSNKFVYKKYILFEWLILNNQINIIIIHDIIVINSNKITFINLIKKIQQKLF